MNSFSRRTALKGTLAVLALGPALAACGGKDNSSGSAASSGGSATLTYWASNRAPAWTTTRRC